MISADFYPTQTTQFNTEYTNTIPNLDYTDPEKISAPYYMGYINYEDIPPVLKASYCKFVYNDTEAYVEFTDITNAENVPWFFTGIYSTSGNIASHAYYRLNTDTNKYVTNSDMSGMGHWGFLNSLQIERVSYRENFSLTFTIQFLDMSTNPPVYNSNTYVDSDTKVFSSYSDVEDFLSNTTPITFTYTKYGETYTAEIYARDIESGYYEVTTTNGYLWRFYLTDFSTFIPERDIQPNSTMANYSNIGVGTLMHYNHPTKGVIPLLNNLFSWHYPPAENRYLNIVFNATTRDVYNGRWIDSWTALGGFQCKIPYAFFLNATNYQVARFGNCIITKMGSNLNYLKRVFTLNEVLKTYVYMFTRLTTTISTAYGFNDDMKIPLFNDDNSPMWDYVSGELEEIQSQLQPWQYTNITTNTFTEDDIPEYVPPSPPDEDEESGTRIPNQFRYFTGANNFISQYAMKATQIQTFGQMLWNSWAESTTFVDAVNNFWIALNIENFTGSFDISSVMNFIVSLKVFPFNITHFDTDTFILTDTLRIGRGTFPFLFPSQVGNIIKVLSNIVYVDCGLIHDPTTGQYGIPRKFNDFRDYTNVSITCFCPYCGTVELNPGDVVGRQLSCKYAVDLQTGECLCLITVADSTGDLYNVAAISGNMGANIPVSATNSGLIESRRLSDAGNALGLFGGMFTENLSMGSNTFAKAKDSQSSIGAIASASTQAASNLFKDIKQTSNFAANMLSRGAIGCPMMQGGSGFAAFSQADTPYIQIRYGIYSEPANYSHSVGRISTKSGTLSDYKDSGLVICENVDVSGFTCHEDERSEIKALLESGVYL